MEYNLAKPSWWIRPLLFIAFVYSLAWGLAIIFAPGYVFTNAVVELPNHIYMWQTLGAIEIMLGIGYFISFINPYRHWAPVFIGVGYKIVSTAIFINGALSNGELINLSNYVFIDNLIWLLPFVAILVQTYRHSLRGDDLLIETFEDDQITLDMFETSEGVDLNEMTHRSPTMVVFLRHFGCTFCREALLDISQQRKQIEAKGVKIILVHMLEDEDEARNQVAFYGPDLVDIALISDPEGILYKKFRLRRGTFWQLLGGKVVFRALSAGILKGKGLGKEMGDTLPMPGVFVMHLGEVIKKYVHTSSADRPKYTQIADVSNEEAA
ncbi:hypothetical protein BH09BAC1_BH09BAC1_14170 [soil metagenome]